jgi:hypothetical protein
MMQSQRAKLAVRISAGKPNLWTTAGFMADSDEPATRKLTWKIY